MGEVCIDLLKSLLNKDLNQRILPGDIKSHPWFASIDFERIKMLTADPPYRPGKIDIGNYGNMEKDLLKEKEIEIVMTKSEEIRRFSSYNDDCQEN